MVCYVQDEHNSHWACGDNPVFDCFSVVSLWISSGEFGLNSGNQFRFSNFYSSRLNSQIPMINSLLLLMIITAVPGLLSLSIIGSRNNILCALGPGAKWD